LYEHPVHKIRSAFFNVPKSSFGCWIAIVMRQPQRTVRPPAIGRANFVTAGASSCIASIIILSASMIAALDSQRVHARQAGGGDNSWTELAPLPDPVGYGGMFCGALRGKLVAGGGSQFHDRPIWLAGEKAFSDRIFTLASASAQWEESSQRLPFKVGHFASAATGDAIYLIGGVNATGCLANAVRITADEDGLVFSELPSLPRPLAYAAAAIAGDRLYVVGGLGAVGSKQASQETWSLDLSPQREPISWRREPDLPGPGVHVACAAAQQDKVYLIGGIGFDQQGTPVPSSAVYSLAVGAQKWEILSSLPAPRVGPVSPCPVVDGQVCVIGGYAEVFPGLPREHPGFCKETFIYDLKQKSWRAGQPLPVTPVLNRDAPGDPGPKPMIAAPCCFWDSSIVIVGGEVRSSVRTPAVLTLPIEVACRPILP
jgi:N-acetylneuraminic acid mutarotase